MQSVREELEDNLTHLPTYTVIFAKAVDNPPEDRVSNGCR